MWMKRILFFGLGFIIWLLATIAMRLGGQLFFLDENPLVLILLWVFAVVGLVVIALSAFRWQRLGRWERYEAAILMVIPGMVLDAFILEGFAAVFPNMPPTAADSFGGWLLISYASVLIAALLPDRVSRAQP